MFSKTYLYAGLALIAVAVVVSFFMQREDKNVPYYAKKFCDCSAKLAAMNAQEGETRPEADAFAAAQAEHIQCMGDDNPFAQRKGLDSVQFLSDVVREMRRQCPETARNMGFKVD